MRFTIVVPQWPSLRRGSAIAADVSVPPGPDCRRDFGGPSGVARWRGGTRIRCKGREGPASGGQRNELICLGRRIYTKTRVQRRLLSQGSRALHGAEDVNSSNKKVTGAKSATMSVSRKIADRETRHAQGTAPRLYVLTGTSFDAAAGKSTGLIPALGDLRSLCHAAIHWTFDESKRQRPVG